LKVLNTFSSGLKLTTFFYYDLFVHVLLLLLDFKVQKKSSVGLKSGTVFRFVAFVPVISLPKETTFVSVPFTCHAAETIFTGTQTQDSLFKVVAFMV
jgi:hypothetical protein